jgi:deoxyadenosine/deoxycytidine kinase
MKKFVAIAGNMGVGKTTMVQFLSDTYGFEPVYEPFMNNPYLDDFYEDMNRWSFHSQLYFLSHKFRLHMKLNNAPKVVIQDRSIYEDAEIFCTNLYRTEQMNRRDYETYMELYQTMRTALQPPDLMIYLRCSVKAIRKRIKLRGREREQQIPVTYIEGLNDLYEEWVDRYTLSPVLIWDSERMDYICNLVDRVAFQDAIEKVIDINSLGSSD